MPVLLLIQRISDTFVTHLKVIYIRALSDLELKLTFSTDLLNSHNAVSVKLD